MNDSLRGPGLSGHVAVVDLSYGDAGKGTTVDFLARQGADLVVRFNGGAQAAHNVVTPEGLHHTFSQFGSGTFAGVPTLLSRFVVVEPLALLREAGHLETLGVSDPLGLVEVDPSALVTSFYHQLANRAREEARGRARHGSCGVGVGATVQHSLEHPEDALRFADLSSAFRVRAKLKRIRSVLEDELGPLAGPSLGAVTEALVAAGERVRVAREDALERALQRGPVVFEGAQGVLLDEWRGFHPHTTWSTTTFENVDSLLVGTGEDVFRLGVVRSYTTRHGAGPHVTEDLALRDTVPEPHNGTGVWQGDFRVGHLDLVAHRYALAACGRVDGLSLTHLDRTDPRLQVCSSYATTSGVLTDLPLGVHQDLGHQEALTNLLVTATPRLRQREGSWVDEVETGLGVPVVLGSTGPTWRDKAYTNASASRALLRSRSVPVPAGV